jgi:hypothetical protein
MQEPTEASGMLVPKIVASEEKYGESRTGEEDSKVVQVGQGKFMDEVGEVGFDIGSTKAEHGSRPTNLAYADIHLVRPFREQST